MCLQDAIFDEYRISSQNNDCIAFQVDLSLLLRALRSSVAMDGDKLQVKLVKKRASLTEKSMPFLTFESKVRNLQCFCVAQHVPLLPPSCHRTTFELLTLHCVLVPSWQQARTHFILQQY
jgi:HUS1 checkpoint protein